MNITIQTNKEIQINKLIIEAKLLQPDIIVSLRKPITWFNSNDTILETWSQAVIFSNVTLTQEQCESLIENHTPDQIKIKNISAITHKISFTTNNKKYTCASSIIFPGELYDISSVSFIAFCENPNQTCYIRIYDITNYKVIAECNTTSTTPTIVTQSTIQNIPNDNSIFEIQIKSSGGNVYLNAWNILTS